MVPSTPARIRYLCRQVTVACSARAAARVSWIARGRMPSWRPERAAVVHWARAGHGWQAARGNTTMILSVPSWRAGLQVLLTDPCGQVTCWLSQSTVNIAAA